MLRISKLTDYAVMLATSLPSEGETRSVRDLAAESSLPLATVSKVLKLLAKAGVVTSQRGPSGGYRLTRAAEATPVVDVITAIEGPIAVTECSDDATASGCEYESQCGTRANWKRINDAVLQALSEIPLSEMVAFGPHVSGEGSSSDRLVPLLEVAPARTALRETSAHSASTNSASFSGRAQGE